MRAYANLTAMRNNLPSGYVHEEDFYKMFDTALNELQQAGAEVNEWRFPPDAVGGIDALEFRAKIDAILLYFTIEQEKTAIGFRK